MPPPPPGIDLENEILPSVYTLEQSFPNPFNSSTVIKFQLPYNSKVKLKIYDLLGQEVETLVNESQSAGNQQVTWNANHVASGLYFYKIEATSIADPSKSYTNIMKMILIK